MDPRDDPWDGRRYLTEVQYANESKLAARQSIYAFQDPKVGLYPWALNLVDLTGDDVVVDVGCGNGYYLAHLKRRGHRGPLLGVDLSMGMLAATLTRVPGVAVVNADAAAIPLATGSADVLLAMHMLYHCPDRAAAIAELARTTRLGGVALVMTNSAAHLVEMDELLGGAVEDVTGSRPERIGRDMRKFQVEGAGEELGVSFANLELHRAESALHLTDPEPVVEYARSMSAFLTTNGSEVLDPVMDRIRSRVTAAIAAAGEFYVTTSVGCFVCRH